MTNTKLNVPKIFVEHKQEKIEKHTAAQFEAMKAHCEKGDLTMNGALEVTYCNSWKHKKYGYKRFLDQVGLAPSVHHKLKRKYEYFPYTNDNTYWGLDAGTLNKITDAVKTAMRVSGGEIYVASELLNENHVFGVDSVKWSGAKLANFIYFNQVLSEQYRDSLRNYARN